MLTELDGRIGDGDLGITLLKAFRAIDGLKEALPADLGQALLQMGAATVEGLELELRHADGDRLLRWQRR